LLLTNDDGIEAEGMLALAAALAPEHDLLVVAPDRDMSGTSAAIARIDGGPEITFTRRELAGLPAVAAYSVAAGPGLAVLSACLGGFGEPPDVVLSGVNAGSNTGHSILHSGTVGAVLTAQSFGRKGLAVSLAPGTTWRWDTACAFALRLLDELADMPARTVLNVNVPARGAAEVVGVRRATLDRFGTIRVSLAQETDQMLQLQLRDGAVEPAPGTDSALLAEGFVTFTPIVGVAEAAVDGDLGVGSIEVSREVVAGNDRARPTATV
jgi:5'-nucleotidase